MKSVKSTLFIILTTLCAFVVSCNNSTPLSNSSPTNSSANNANPNATTNKSNQSSANVPGSSPTATIKAWREAISKKDAEAFLKTYAQADVEYMTERAKAENLPLNSWVKQGYFDSNKGFLNIGIMFPPTLEVSNEQINGDTATLGIKNKKRFVKTEFVFMIYEGSNYEEGLKHAYAVARLFFVKENGEWKLSPKSAPPFTLEEKEALDQARLDESTSN